MALILYRPLFWLSVLICAAYLLWLARAVHLRWSPALYIRLLVIVLVLTAAFFSNGQVSDEDIRTREVLIVDGSSVREGEDGSQTPTDIVEEIERWQSEDPQRVVLATDWEPMQAPPSISDRTLYGGNDLSLGEAFHVAGEVLDMSGGRAYLVLGDDSWMAEQEVRELSNLVAHGFPISVVMVSKGQSRPETVSLGSLIVPPGVWTGSRVSAVLPVTMSSEGDVEFTFIINGRIVEQRSEQLPRGRSFISFEVRTNEAEQLRLTAHAASAGNESQDDATSYAVLKVYRSIGVLIVSNSPLTVERLGAGLSAEGVSMEVIHPSLLSTDLRDLDEYDVLVLHNIVATALSQAQMQAMVDFVESGAGAMLFLGGHGAYTLGGYQDTLFEPVLPVRLSPPNRHEKEPLSFLIVLDRSDSMTYFQSEVDGIFPMDLAREAALRAVERLEASDILGVLAYSGDWEWVVPLSPLGEGLQLRQAQDEISRIESEGATLMYSALQEAVAQLSAERTWDTRHILLLSDGRSADGSPEEFAGIAHQARASGITISTIALGEEADLEMLELIAVEGGGRFLQVADPQSLPRVMVAEGDAARGENIQLGETSPMLVSDQHPILSGMSESDLPAIQAYIALESRVDEGAEDILVSANFRDPLLSTWQVGLGRIGTWMSDLGEEWAPQWGDWKDQGRFWTQVIQYMIVNPESGNEQVDIRFTSDEMEITALLRDDAGMPINQIPVRFHYLDADGSEIQVPLPQAGPGEFRGILPIPSPGAYEAWVLIGTDEHVRGIQSPFAVNPPDLSMSSGMTSIQLHDLIEQSGGQIITFEEFLSRESQDDRRLGSVGELSGLSGLALVLILLWPIEIVLRRNFLPWQQ